MEQPTLDLTNDPTARRAALFYAALIAREQPMLSQTIIKQVYEIDPQTTSQMLVALSRTARLGGVGHFDQ